MIDVLPRFFLLFLTTIFLVSQATTCVDADMIESSEIGAIGTSTIGSGNGTLDLRMFTFSGAEIDNAAGIFNGDNGNRTLPQGGGADINSFAESYITTAGELQDFYRLNFPDGFGGSTVSELALFLDLNETGAVAQATNLLNVLDIIINPTSVQGSPNPAGDVTGALQAGIDQTFTGGTTEAFLSTSHNLPVLQQGGGFADYVIFTGIDPFSMNAGDVVLINVSMSALNNGAEEIFLSGEFAPQEINTVPEPSMTIVGAVAGLMLIVRRRRY